MQHRSGLDGRGGRVAMVSWNAATLVLVNRDMVGILSAGIPASLLPNCLFGTTVQGGIRHGAGIVVYTGGSG